MTPEQTAKQLRLAADIIETGHPWEFQPDHSQWVLSGGRCPLYAIGQRWPIRPVLVTPPDGRPLHNPDNLTAEQVGVGYRLTLKGEPTNLHIELQEYWSRGEWKNSGKVHTRAFDENQNARCTYRLPLSVPWPPAPVDPYAELKAAHAAGKVIQILNPQNRYVDADPTWASPVGCYRVKPEAPPFQLPPPPPGMQWQGEAWQKGDLPPACRPIVLGEKPERGDECFSRVHRYEEWERVSGLIGADEEELSEHIVRTTRPLTFEHEGKTWQYHRPGDARPCDGAKQVIPLVFHNGKYTTGGNLSAIHWNWNDENFIGWRYAEPATKEVELGPEDVRCGDEIQDARGDSRVVVRVSQNGVDVYGLGFYSFAALQDCLKIRRRDSNEFVPCSKTVPA